MEEIDRLKKEYHNFNKQLKKRQVEIKYTIKSYEELKKVIKMAKNMTKNKEISEIRFDLSIDFYIE